MMSMSNEAGIYSVVFEAVDNAGNRVKITRTLTIYGDPVITIDDEYKEETIRHMEVADYDPMGGVEATDAVDGDLTDAVAYQPDNVEDFTNGVPGEYVLTFTVKNSGNREATATKKVTIVGAPKIIGADNKTITEGDDFDPMAGVSAVLRQCYHRHHAEERLI